MSEGTKFVVGGCVVILVIIGVSFIFRAASLAETKTFGVAEANAQTQVYEESKSFIDGTIRTLRTYQVDYLKSTSEDHKAGLRGIIIGEADKIREERLPEDLKKFVQDIKAKQKNLN